MEIGGQWNGPRRVHFVHPKNSNRLSDCAEGGCRQARAVERVDFVDRGNCLRSYPLSNTRLGTTGSRHCTDLLKQPKQVWLTAFLDELPARQTIEIHSLTTIVFPVGGTPKKAPRWVPRIVKRAATLSPSAITSSSVH